MKMKWKITLKIACLLPFRCFIEILFIYLFSVFLQNVIEKKIVKDKHIFTAKSMKTSCNNTSRWYKPVIDYISHTLQPTIKLIYCHLSDTSPQLPHFSCKDRSVMKSYVHFNSSVQLSKYTLSVFITLRMILVIDPEKWFPNFHKKQWIA